MKNKQNDFRSKHRTEWHEFLWNRFLEQFSDVKFKRAINSLFSNYEKRLITKRLAALALIKEGIGSREIGNLLWLSRSTISALRKSLFDAHGDYKSQRSRTRKRDYGNLKFDTGKNGLPEDFLGDITIWEIIKNPPPPWYRSRR